MFWTPPSIPWLTVPLIHLVRHHQLKFLGHILRMSKEEPARRYALYIPTIGKRRPGRPRTSYLNYVQDCLEIMKEQCKNSSLPLLLMIVDSSCMEKPSSRLPPQPMDDDDELPIWALGKTCVLNWVYWKTACVFRPTHWV